MLKCSLILSEVPLHLYQIIAGFELLACAGKIELEIVRLSPGNPRRLPYNMLEVIYGNQRLFFDMNDGYDNLLIGDENYIDFYNSILGKCDCLFKRSFNRELNGKLAQPDKIRRTPPNYFVTVKGNPAHWPSPCDPKKEKLKKLFRLLPTTQYFNGYSFEDKFRAHPVIHSESKILFMARLWDPKGEYKGQLTHSKSEERKEINETRAKCIRACRNEFGAQFFGGVASSEFSEREYPDLVIENSSAAKKNEYVKRMKDADILVATAGLHKSTGWKFAEYIASSKAIVSEPLFYESAGCLADGKNYLSFRNEIECCERISELFDERARLNMMRVNAEYYSQFMSCEKLVGNALKML
jgi:hypothetical protein